PSEEYVVNPALNVAAASTGLNFNVVSLAIGGRVTLNGANPVSTSQNCATYGEYRGVVRFRDTTNGHTFSFSLAGCTNTNATFTGTVFPGTYKVTVEGSYSNLPSEEYVVNPALNVAAASTGLNFDVVSIPIGGRVTLNGANPISTSQNCASYGEYRGVVRFRDASNSYNFSFSLAGCTNTNATFTGTVFPGTYKVTVEGSYSDLPSEEYVVASGLLVP
ncbi:MAG: hypothetical protein ACO1OB_21710, partial [Archangium sp.]